MKTATDAVQILHAIVGDSPEIQAMIEEEREKRRVANLIYDARTAAGLTQAELAARVGTRQSAIARLEDADYEGHSLTMLARVAEALNQRVEVRFVPRRTQEDALPPRRRTKDREESGIAA